MYNTFEFAKKKIRVFKSPDNVMSFRAADVASILGYKHTSTIICDNVCSVNKKLLRDLIDVHYPDGTEIFNHLKYGDLSSMYISKNGVSQLLIKCRLPNKTKIIEWFADKFEINVNVMTILYKEQQTLGQIIEAFGSLEYKLQYPIGNYKVDLYFPTKNVATECDEFDHRWRDPDYEKTREDYIKDKLNCKIVRYNPDDPQFSIFRVINNIRLAME